MVPHIKNLLRNQVQQQLFRSQTLGHNHPDVERGGRASESCHLVIARVSSSRVSFKTPGNAEEGSQSLKRTNYVQSSSLEKLKHGLKAQQQ